MRIFHWRNFFLDARRILFASRKILLPQENFFHSKEKDSCSKILIFQCNSKNSFLCLPKNGVLQSHHFHALLDLLLLFAHYQNQQISYELRKRYDHVQRYCQPKQVYPLCKKGRENNEKYRSYFPKKKKKNRHLLAVKACFGNIFSPIVGTIMLFPVSSWKWWNTAYNGKRHYNEEIYRL